jgi:hypothetical protein
MRRSVIARSPSLDCQSSIVFNTDFKNSFTCGVSKEHNWFEDLRLHNNDSPGDKIMYSNGGIKGCNSDLCVYV